MRQETLFLFTSCNEKYMRHLPTLFLSVHEHMPGYAVEFYFLHTADIPQEQTEKLRRFCDQIHIRFQAVEISSEDLARYQEIKDLTSGKSAFPVEGFFDILPNLHLPPYVDRALYLDAGDVILAGDISPYYFSDFNGNILTVSHGFADRWDYSAEDLYELKSYRQIGAEYFNSGVVLFNVALMRQLNINFDYYCSIVKLARSIHGSPISITFKGERGSVAYDDQGLLAIAFVGYIQFFELCCPESLDSAYNFRPFVAEYNQKNLPNAAQLSLEELQPKIIHLLGNKPGTPQHKRKTLLPISRQCLSLWDELEAKADKILKRQT